MVETGRTFPLSPLSSHTDRPWRLPDKNGPITKNIRNPQAYDNPTLPSDSWFPGIKQPSLMHYAKWIFGKHNTSGFCTEKETITSSFLYKLLSYSLEKPLSIREHTWQLGNAKAACRLSNNPLITLLLKREGNYGWFTAHNAHFGAQPLSYNDYWHGRFRSFSPTRIHNSLHVFSAP